MNGDPDRVPVIELGAWRRGDADRRRVADALGDACREWGFFHVADRLSFPFFFDPHVAAEIRPIELPGTDAVDADRQERWDRASVHVISGTYGDYLLRKVAKVFPALRCDVRPPGRNP